MKKVSELEGSELDYWVARAEGMKKGRTNYAGYSTHWAVGGPIIEREEIVWTWTNTLDDESMPQRMAIPCRVWDLRHKSPLVAAMRLFVRRKFGDEVDDSQAHHTPQSSLNELAKDDICGKYIVKIGPKSPE